MRAVWGTRVLGSVMVWAMACSGGGGAGIVKDLGVTDDALGRGDGEIILSDVQDADLEIGDVAELWNQEVFPADTRAEAWVPQPCQSHEDCPGGYCVEVVPGSGEYVCTVTCIDECPGDWVCKSVFIEGPDPVSICLPPSDTLCKVCQTDAACLLSGSLCIKSGSGLGFCGRQCGSGAPECPKGFECVLIEDEWGEPLGQQCVPQPGYCCEQGALVNCDDGNVCTFDGCDPALGCVYEPVDGECYGDDPCMEYSCVEGECVGVPVVLDDTLDKVDNDCDGLTDEDAYKEFRLSGGLFVSGGGVSDGDGLTCVGEISAPPIEGVAEGIGLVVRTGLLWLLGGWD